MHWLKFLINMWRVQYISVMLARVSCVVFKNPIITMKMDSLVYLYLQVLEIIFPMAAEDLYGLEPLTLRA